MVEVTIFRESSQSHRRLRRAEPVLKVPQIDDAATMGAVANLAIAIPSLDLEHHALGLDFDDASDHAASRE